MIHLSTLAAAMLAVVFEDDASFARLVDAAQQITTDRDAAEREAEAIVTILNRGGSVPGSLVAPRVHVRVVTPHGVRVNGRQYSGTFLLAHVGYPVAVELARDADHPERHLAIVRTAEGGVLLGTAYVAEETLADVLPSDASPMLRRVRFELDAAA